MIRILGYLYADQRVDSREILAVIYTATSPTTTATVAALTDAGWATRATHPCASLMSPFGSDANASVGLVQAGAGALLTYTYTRGTNEGVPPSAIGQNNLYRSTDGGVTWTLCSGPTYVHQVHATPDGTCYAITIGPLGNTLNGEIWRSDDQGATWTRQSIWTQRLAGLGFATTHSPVAMMVNPVNPDHILINQSGWWLSTDGGVTFPPDPTPNIPAPTIIVAGTPAKGGAADFGHYTPDGNWVVLRANSGTTPGFVIAALPETGGDPFTAFSSPDGGYISTNDRAGMIFWRYDERPDRVFNHGGVAPIRVVGNTMPTDITDIVVTPPSGATNSDVRAFVPEDPVPLDTIGGRRYRFAINTAPFPVLYQPAAGGSWVDDTAAFNAAFSSSYRFARDGALRYKSV